LEEGSRGFERQTLGIEWVQYSTDALFGLAAGVESAQWR
jgi:hypothetical protein